MISYPISRRDLLARSGVGLGLLGLAGVLADAGLTAAGPATDPLAPKKPPRPAKAKRVIHIFANGGPSQVDTFDPKPALAKVRRQAAADGEPPHRTEDRGGLAVAVQVQEVRPVRPRSQRTLRTDGQAHRRHLRHPLDARRRAEPRAVAAADELRRSPARPAELRLVGDVRPRHREPEPARRSSPCAPAAIRFRNRRTGRVGFLPGIFQGTYIDTKHTNVEKLIENIRNTSHARGANSASNSTCCNASTAIHRRSARRTRNSKPASNRSNSPTACRREATDAFDIESRAEARRRGVRRRAGRSAGRCSSPAGSSNAASASSRSGTARASRGTTTTTSKSTTAASPRNATPAIAALLTDLKRLRPARRNADHLGRRIRPHAGRRIAPGREQRREDQRPRPQPLGLHRLAGRRRREGRHRSSARPTNSASRPSRTPSTSTTCTPRSCTCSASTTRSSPTATPAATSA